MKSALGIGIISEKPTSLSLGVKHMGVSETDYLGYHIRVTDFRKLPYINRYMDPYELRNPLDLGSPYPKAKPKAFKGLHPTVNMTLATLTNP